MSLESLVVISAISLNQSQSARCKSLCQESLPSMPNIPEWRKIYNGYLVNKLQLTLSDISDCIVCIPFVFSVPSFFSNTKFGSLPHSYRIPAGLSVLVWQSSFENYQGLPTLIHVNLTVFFLPWISSPGCKLASRLLKQRGVFAPKLYTLENEGRKCLYCIRQLACTEGDAICTILKRSYSLSQNRTC